MSYLTYWERLKWRGVEFCKDWGITLEIGQYGDYGASLHVGLIYGSVFIPLPFNFREWDRSRCIAPSYGFSWKWSGYRGALFLHWFDKCRIVHMPWEWAHVRHDILMSDGNWKRVLDHSVTGDPFHYDCSPWKWNDKHQEQHPYTYNLRNGKTQERVATIGVEEREWRWRIFKKLPITRRIERSIQVEFNEEVGEKSGSWKGGCVGCGYTMKPGETPLECLRRMESERKF